MPFTGDDLKGFCLFGHCLLLRFADRSRVNAMRDLPPRLFPSLSGICKRYFRITLCANVSETLPTP